MFKLFDEDGNGSISIDELLNMMAFFIELGMDTGNVDMAKTMAEVFSLGDINKDEKLSKIEFVQVSIKPLYSQFFLFESVHLKRQFAFLCYFIFPYFSFKLHFIIQTSCHRKIF